MPRRDSVPVVISIGVAISVVAAISNVVAIAIVLAVPNVVAVHNSTDNASTATSSVEATAFEIPALSQSRVCEGG